MVSKPSEVVPTSRPGWFQKQLGRLLDQLLSLVLRWADHLPQPRDGILASRGQSGIRVLVVREPPPPPVALTCREAETMIHIGYGLSDKGIAQELRMSRRTVGTHIGHTLHKLALGSRAAIARYALLTAPDRSPLSSPDHSPQRS